MAKAIEQIAESLAVLERAIAHLSTELYNSYFNYLTNLGKAVRQQLILASYHLCTQGNPTGFLSLSLREKQNLQQDLRHLGGQIQEKLLAQLLSEQDSEQPENLDAEGLANGDEKTELDSSRETQPKDPETLAQWQEELEKKIGQTLKTCSRDANRLLQQAGILPKQMPEGLLDAALKADSGNEMVAGLPNLLNLMVEAQSNREPENSTFMQLLAIQLRLAEIELADAAVMTGRHQIRHLVSQLSRMRREYQKKQREKAIAEAESAWRAIWIDE